MTVTTESSNQWRPVTGQSSPSAGPWPTSPPGPPGFGTFGQDPFKVALADLSHFSLARVRLARPSCAQRDAALRIPHVDLRCQLMASAVHCAAPSRAEYRLLSATRRLALFVANVHVGRELVLGAPHSPPPHRRLLVPVVRHAIRVVGVSQRRLLVPIRVVGVSLASRDIAQLVLDVQVVVLPVLGTRNRRTPHLGSKVSSKDASGRLAHRILQVDVLWPLVRHTKGDAAVLGIPIGRMLTAPDLKAHLGRERNCEARPSQALRKASKLRPRLAKAILQKSSAKF